MKKITFPLFLTVCALSFSAQAQKVKDIHTGPTTKSLGVIYHEQKPYYAIKTQGKLTIVQKTIIDQLNSEWYEKVDVYKGQQALDLFGEKTKDGAVIITIKEEKQEEVLKLLNNRKD